MLRESHMSSPLTHKSMFCVHCMSTASRLAQLHIIVNRCAPLLYCCYHISISYIDLKYFVLPVGMLVLKSRIFYYIAIQCFYEEKQY